MTFDGEALVRAVYKSELLRSVDGKQLEEYVADRMPSFYRDPRKVAAEIEGGHFFTAIRKTLERIPDAQSFRDSHFGEILAGIYGQGVLGLRLLYSKLQLLTSANANAYTMDLLFYRPGCDPAEFVLAEVKSSLKSVEDGLPANHDKSCFKSVFDSFNKYKQGDLEFDLAAVEEKLDAIPEPDCTSLKTALIPFNSPNIKFAAFCVIDSGTHSEEESRVLGARKNEREFEADIVCVAELGAVARATFDLIDAHS
jgi:hypothetical protein